MNYEAIEIPRKSINLGFKFECKLFDKNENTTAKFPARGRDSKRGLF